MTMKPNTYKVLITAIEDGVACGVRRALKHREDNIQPETLAAIQNAVEEEVITSICEWFHLDRMED